MYASRGRIYSCAIRNIATLQIVQKWRPPRTMRSRSMASAVVRCCSIAKSSGWGRLHDGRAERFRVGPDIPECYRPACYIFVCRATFFRAVIARKTSHGDDVASHCLPAHKLCTPDHTTISWFQAGSPNRRFGFACYYFRAIWPTLASAQNQGLRSNPDALLKTRDIPSLADRWPRAQQQGIQSHPLRRSFHQLSRKSRSTSARKTIRPRISSLTALRM
jgi:hypothetical protein